VSLKEASFDEEDARLLEQCSNQIAIAVDNALAYREIEAVKNKLAQEKVERVPNRNSTAARAAGGPPVPKQQSDVSLSTLESIERDHIFRVLEEARWVVAGPGGAAARLGIKRTTLQAKMRKLGISRRS